MGWEIWACYDTDWIFEDTMHRTGAWEEVFLLLFFYVCSWELRCVSTLGFLDIVILRPVISG